MDTRKLHLDHVVRPAERVLRTLERIAAERGYPRKLRLDNGPEMVSVTLAEWAEQHNVILEFIKPGRPMQNGFIERFNRSYREAVPYVCLSKLVRSA